MYCKTFVKKDNNLRLWKEHQRSILIEGESNWWKENLITVTIFFPLIWLKTVKWGIKEFKVKVFMFVEL